MTPADDSPIWEWLRQWEQARREGREVSPEELAGDHPELVSDLRVAIAGLRATAWMDRPLLTGASNDPQAGPAVLPSSLGPYLLLEQIGVGGQGRVFKARHLRMDRIVAVKLLPHVLAAPHAVERFQQEVHVAAKLVHPNVVQAYDAGEQDGHPYLVTEFIDGVDLARLVHQQGPLPVAQVIDYVMQAAAGLQYAHGKGVIHKDIKPANLMLTPDGVVKVLDLGLATTRPAVAAGEGQALAGSVDFLPPEQADPSATPDHRADIYALGCTLFFLLTGRVIFPAGSVLEKFKAHREQQPPPLRRERAEVSAALDAVFKRMVAKKPEDRFQSMAEVRQALERAARRSWHTRGWLGLLVAATVLASGIVIWAAWNPKATTTTNGKVQSPEKKEQTPAVVRPDLSVREVYRLQAHDGPVRCLAFTGDGTTLFTGGDDKKVVRHDLKAGKAVATLTQPQAPTALTATAKLDRLFVGTVNGQVRLWGLDGEKPREIVAVPCHASAVNRMAVSDDGMLLLTGDNKEACLWDWSGDRPRTAKLPQTGGPVLDVRFTPGKLEFATCVAPGKDKPVEVWRWSLDAETKAVKPMGVARPRESTNATAFVVNGRVMAAAVGGEIYAWEFTSGQAIGVYQGDTKSVRYLATAKDADVVISAETGKVHCWDGGNLHRRWEFDIPAITALVVSPDGRRVAVGTEGGGVVVLGPR